MHNAFGSNHARQAMSSPFDSLVRSRAAFSGVEHQSDVVNGLAFADAYGRPAPFSNQENSGPPLAQARGQSLEMKVSAPPLMPSTLDFSTSISDTGPALRMNAAGILLKGKEGQTKDLEFPEIAALKAPAKSTETAALKLPEAVSTDNVTAARRIPSLSPLEFTSLGHDAAKYANANDISTKYVADGTVKKFTLSDFSALTVRGKNDGSVSATLTDPYARPLIHHDIDADGNSSVSRFKYSDDGSKKAMFASVVDVTANGVTKSMIPNKFGKITEA